MSEIFNFKRFGTYFLYDLKQMWRKHSRPAIMIGFSIAIFYILWVLFGLVFSQNWSAPSIEFRVMMFTVAFTILEFYQAKTYGFLTEKKAGSAWLMVPASRADNPGGDSDAVLPGLFCRGRYPEPAGPDLWEVPDRKRR